MGGARSELEPAALFSLVSDLDLNPKLYRLVVNTLDVGLSHVKLNKREELLRWKNSQSAGLSRVLSECCQ
jgi:hypothetical protein